MEYKIDKFLKLKLENDKTVIYINEEQFMICKKLLIDLPNKNTNSINKKELSINELAEKSKPLFKYNIDAKMEFWAHCSNLQAWKENNYDTALLHSSIAFPLLKRLIEVGDSVANKVFKDEIGRRFADGHLQTIKFLEEESYLNYLNNEELNTILKLLITNLINNKNIEQTLSVLNYLAEIHFLNAEKFLRMLIKNRLKNGDVLLSKLLLEKNYIYYLSYNELYKCLISGDILKKIDQYVLDKLELHSEFDSGEGSGFIIKGNRIVGLDLWGYIPKSFPEEILELDSLKSLRINSDYLNLLPETLSKLSSLKELYLDRNQLTTLPKSIGDLISLKILDLDCNNLLALPDSIGKLRNLKKISIVSNNLEELPESIGNIKSLESINISSNLLLKLPESFKELKNLKELYLNNNKFSIFPEVITQLKSLKRLSMKLNNILIIPNTIGNLSFLTYLNFSGNRFKSLPDSINSLNCLKTLTINQSNLESLPESIGNLQSLEKLYLFNHNIKTFPESIDNLSSLKELDIRSTKIHDFSKILNRLKKLRQKNLRIF